MLLLSLILAGSTHLNAIEATPSGADTPVPTPAGQAPPPKISYSSCHVDGPYLAMTFDDGPHPVLTPKLLDILKARGIKATFFVIGQNAEKYPDIVRRIVAEGHEIANHTWSHPQLTKIAPGALHDEITKTSEVLADITSHPPTLMRPPYGATSPLINQWLSHDLGMKVIIWSVDPLDWRYHDSARVQSTILAGASPGAIILSHDIHATTVAAMPETLDRLLAKGFQFVTVSELIAMDKPVAKEAKAQVAGPGVVPPPSKVPQ